jgi:acyl-CoA thioester hydrolase
VNTPGIETHRATVQENQCDMMGHLTTREYGSFFGPASWKFLAGLGYDVDKYLKLRIGMVEAQHLTRFIHELLAGDEVYVESFIRKLGTRSITTSHRLVRAGGGILCAEFEAVSVMFDLDQRRAIPLVDELRIGASKLLEEAA